MALTNLQAYNLAVDDDLFRQRIQTAMTNKAYSIWSDPANADGIKQAKRLALASKIQRDPKPYITSFAWAVVNRVAGSDPTGILDSEIINLTQNTAFDQLADMLIDAASVVAAEAQGVTAVGAAVTSVANIAHNLGVAPTADKFWFAFAADPLSAGFAWASSITTTTFTLNVKAAPGGGGTSVAWRVKT